MKPCVFIQTNPQQDIGALVAAHSLKRNSHAPERFDIRFMHVDQFPFLQSHEGQPFMRTGGQRIWTMADLQSFTPLRFAPPKLMNYSGRAVVIDPDVFAVGDVNELFERDMAGHAILCRYRPGEGGRLPYYSSSVMLLDCAKLRHWDVEPQFNELFQFKRDYLKWIQLRLEPEGSIGLLEDEWNDFDRLTDRTKLLHTTKRRTQPWKTGLPMDFTPSEHEFVPLPQRAKRWARRLLGKPERGSHYKAHPDPRQEALFFRLLGECLDNGTVTEAMIKDAMARNYIRHDAFAVLDRWQHDKAA